MLPYDAEHLTPTEKAAEALMERRNCTNCDHQQIHARSGYRGCNEPDADPKAVMGGERCRFWEGR